MHARAAGAASWIATTSPSSIRTFGGATFEPSPTPRAAISATDSRPCHDQICRAFFKTHLPSARFTFVPAYTPARLSRTITYLDAICLLQSTTNISPGERAGLEPATPVTKFGNAEEFTRSATELPFQTTAPKLHSRRKRGRFGETISPEKRRGIEPHEAPTANRGQERHRSSIRRHVSFQMRNRSRPLLSRFHPRRPHLGPARAPFQGKTVRPARIAFCHSSAAFMRRLSRTPLVMHSSSRLSIASR